MSDYFLSFYLDHGTCVFKYKIGDKHFATVNVHIILIKVLDMKTYQLNANLPQDLTPIVLFSNEHLEEFEQNYSKIIEYRKFKL